MRPKRRQWMRLKPQLGRTVAVEGKSIKHHIEEHQEATAVQQRPAERRSLRQGMGLKRRQWMRLKPQLGWTVAQATDRRDRFSGQARPAAASAPHPP
jgi:hypothetical protein